MLSNEAQELLKNYAITNLEMAGDSALHDPVLRCGFGPRYHLTREDYEKSQDLITNGCVHSSKYHAVRDIFELCGLNPDDIHSTHS